MIPVKNLANPNSERKRLGAFYTPESLSKVLTDWAIRTGGDRVLEPSFGKCGFLAAAKRRLEELGCSTPKKQIFGCDVDAAAFQFLANVLGAPIDTDRFRQHDFLDLKSGETWSHLFEATVGNPPYIPYQAIPAKRRKAFVKTATAAGLDIDGRASLWAHFVLHAVSFVAPGGRMAWVLPGSLLQANYSSAIREYVSRSFERVLCVLMHQRFFKSEGTEEETVVLLASNRVDGAAKDVMFSEAASIDELNNVILEWDAGLAVGKRLTGRPSYLSINDSVLGQFKEISGQKECRRLGDFLSVRIGLVTGANNFFVLSEEVCDELGIKEVCAPVLAKFKAAKGLEFRQADHASYLAEGGRGYLVHVDELPPEGTPLRTYLNRFPEEERANIGTFKKRSKWYAPDDGKIPGAFMSVMNHEGPRIVLNINLINCTNTIHRVFFVDSVGAVQRKLLSLSLLTSFSQLSAEFVGRRYGSGVLKHEPREAEKIAVLMPDEICEVEVENAFSDVDQLLRSGKVDAAIARADEFILFPMRDGEQRSMTFKAALAEVREQRRTLRYNSADA